MLQLSPTIAVSTPLGDGEAYVIIDYGVNTNTVWLVRMKGGVIKHFYSDDVLIYDNPMNGNGYDMNVVEKTDTTDTEYKQNQTSTTNEETNYIGGLDDGLPDSFHTGYDHTRYFTL